MNDPRIPNHETRLRKAIHELADEIAPARDLWPAIHAQIEADRVITLETAGATGTGSPGLPARTRARLPWVRLAIVAAVLVLASVGITWQYLQPEVPAASLTDVPSPDEPAIARFASYERMTAELSATLEQKSAMLDPATRAVLERSLRTIDEALLEARDALAGDPSSAAIRSFVEAAYRQKLDFLRRANDVAALRGT